VIPKTIHYIWVGGKPLPPLAKKCIESWKKFCPDYEIIKWDETNFDISTSRYCKEAYGAKKFAFVSDYIRLHVLVNHGGVYMDTDVELLKPIDGYLIHQAFSGFENEKSIPTGIMACEKGFPLFHDLLSEYIKRSFILSNGKLNLMTNVRYITKACSKRGLVLNNSLQTVDGFTLYPNDFFCPKSHSSGKYNITERTVAIHHFAGSWVSESEQKIIKERYDFYKKYGNDEYLIHIYKRSVDTIGLKELYRVMVKRTIDRIFRKKLGWIKTKNDLSYNTKN